MLVLAKELSGRLIGVKMEVDVGKVVVQYGLLVLM